MFKLSWQCGAKMVFGQIKFAQELLFKFSWQCGSKGVFRYVVIFLIGRSPFDETFNWNVKKVVQ
jgi:hypothetical protein